MTATRDEQPLDTLALLKHALAQQYAIATDHNRQINQQRARWRSIAGDASRYICHCVTPHLSLRGA
ncbi:MAG: hypothetical protein ACLPX1_03115 [Steroidobacteraceae bacterium]